MFDIGLQELALIFVIALLVFGPKNLPQLGRSLGRAMREFRRASDEFRSTIETNLKINELDPLPDPTPASTSADPVTEPVATAEALPESVLNPLRDAGRRRPGGGELPGPAQRQALPRARLQLGPADRRAGAGLLQAGGRGPGGRLRGLPGLRALGAGRLDPLFFLV